MKSAPLSEEEAQRIAIDALFYLAEDGDRLSRFAALSGVDPALIRTAAGEPGFLAGVLEHFLGHEPDLIALAAALELSPERIAEAHRRLGGASPSW